MTDPVQTPKPPRMRLWLRLVLFASLAFNLLVVGVVAGAVLRGGPDRYRMPDRDVAFAYIGALEEEDRRALRRDAIRRFRADDSLRRDAPRTHYATALTLLRAEPFDAAAFDAVLRRQQQGVLARAEVGREVLVSRVSAMTPEDRAAMADRLEAEIAKRRESPRHPPRP